MACRVFVLDEVSSEWKSKRETTGLMGFRGAAGPVVSEIGSWKYQIVIGHISK